MELDDFAYNAKLDDCMADFVTGDDEREKWQTLHRDAAKASDPSDLADTAQKVAVGRANDAPDIIALAKIATEAGLDLCTSEELDEAWEVLSSRGDSVNEGKMIVHTAHSISMPKNTLALWSESNYAAGANGEFSQDEARFAAKHFGTPVVMLAHDPTLPSDRRRLEGSSALGTIGYVCDGDSVRKIPAMADILASAVPALPGALRGTANKAQRVLADMVLRDTFGTDEYLEAAETGDLVWFRKAQAKYQQRQLMTRAWSRDAIKHRESLRARCEQLHGVQHHSAAPCVRARLKLLDMDLAIRAVDHERVQRRDRAAGRYGRD